MLARKDGSVGEHLSQNAAHRPDVNGLGIALRKGQRGGSWVFSQGPTTTCTLDSTPSEEVRALKSICSAAFWLATGLASQGLVLRGTSRSFQDLALSFPSQALTLEFSIISGARYQRVATYSVRKPVWSCSGSAILARPKSQIWNQDGLLSSMLLDFKAHALMPPSPARLFPLCAECSTLLPKVHLKAQRGWRDQNL